MRTPQELYARSGFTRCGPFADHAHDPNSVFFYSFIQARARVM